MHDVKSALNACQSSCYLVYSKDAIVDIPFLDIDPSVWCVCHTVDRDLDIGCANLSRSLSERGDDILDGIDRSKNV